MKLLNLPIFDVLWVGGNYAGGDISYCVCVKLKLYEAVTGHIGKVLNMQDMASKSSKERIQKSQEYFDRKYVKKFGVHMFAISNIVLIF